MTTYAFTGHRPKDLPAHWNFNEFAHTLTDYLELRGNHERFITGGALGIDTWAAEYALRDSIPLTLIMPFTWATMTKMWREEDRERLAFHMENAAELIVLAANDEYNAALYQKRNIAMIDRCDVLLAFWSGKRYGGTWNAIQYAQLINKPIINLFPGMNGRTI